MRILAYNSGLDILEVCGASREQAHHYPMELSGDQCQCVVVATVLAVKPPPSLLLADESTSLLDPTVTLEVVDVLQKLHKHTQAATVIITHDEGVARRIVTWILYLEGGTVEGRICA